jgi:hypothetical protein
MKLKKKLIRKGDKKKNPKQFGLMLQKLIRKNLIIKQNFLISL